MDERPVLIVDASVSDPRAMAHSFEDFFELEHNRLLGALYLIMGNRFDAQDVMQEAFVRVWERWNLVQSLTSPTGYLYRTALNVWKMRRRRLGVAARRIVRSAERMDPFEEADLRQDVRQALASLPARKRAALVLTDLLGYPVSEAADVLRVKPSTVRSLTTQARAVLRESLGASDG